jgi:hypothetical protein
VLVGGEGNPEENVTGMHYATKQMKVLMKVLMKVKSEL